MQHHENLRNLLACRTVYTNFIIHLPVIWFCFFGMLSSPFDYIHDSRQSLSYRVFEGGWWHWWTFPELSDVSVFALFLISNAVSRFSPRCLPQSPWVWMCVPIFPYPSCSIQLIDTGLWLKAFGKDDVIGCFLDLDSGVLQWSKNGRMFGPAYWLREDQLKQSEPIYPAASLVDTTLELNYGDLPFKFPPEVGVPVSYFCIACDVYECTSQIHHLFIYFPATWHWILAHWVTYSFVHIHISTSIYKGSIKNINLTFSFQEKWHFKDLLTNRRMETGCTKLYLCDWVCRYQ